MNADTLRQKKDVHKTRKFWHAGGILAMLMIYHNTTAFQSLMTTLFFWLLFVPLDVLRHYRPKLNKFVVRVFSRVMRKDELNKISGTSYLLTGVFIIQVTYPRPVNELSLFMLAFADPLAAYFGVRYGKDKIFNDKTFQGSIAAFLVCALTAYAFFFLKNMMTERIILVSIIAGLIGMISEALPVGKLDDNLTFPVISGGLLWGLFHLFGGL